MTIRLPLSIRAASGVLIFPLVLAAAEDARRFSLPAGDAAETLPRFAEQANREIVFSAADVRGVKTNPVSGSHVPRAALDALVAGTGLVATQDRGSGAFGIVRRTASPRPAAHNAAPGREVSAASVGHVRGRVRNLHTGAYLEGARIEIAGTGRSVLTGPDGSFRFRDLPAGEISLEVAYTGLAAERVVANVTPGTEQTLDVALRTRTVQMETFRVSELREGNAMAITQQRNAMNVKEVVATDAFGSLRDGNPAELLVLLPGVAGEWVGNDIRAVQIRGFAANLGSVTVDGSKLANAESAGTNRTFEWDVMSADHIESLEVVKAPTPDMEADSIGGNINLRTKSAFNSSDRRRITGSAGFTYEHVRGTLMPNASFAYSEVLGARRNLGLTFNWGYSKHNVPRDGTQLTYPTNTNEPNYIQLLRVFDQENIRERSGGGMKLDYKLSDRTTVHLNVLSSFFNEQYDKRAMSRRLVLQTNAAGIVPGFTDQRVEWRNTANTTATQEIINTPKFSRTFQVALGARHEFDRWRIDYDATSSDAATYYDSYGRGGGAISPVLRGVGIILDRMNHDRYYPDITQTSGPDIYDIANYTTAPLNFRDQRGEDTVLTLQANATREFATAYPLTLKFGAKYRRQERTAFQRNRRFNYLGPDGRANSGDEQLDRFLEDRRYGMVEGRYPAPRWISVTAMTEALAANPGWFQEDLAFVEGNRLANDRELTESVTAGYAMGNLKLGRLAVLGGLRYELTDIEARANVRNVTPAEAARRAAWVGPVTTDESLRRLRAEYADRITSNADYGKVFPGLHLRYEPRRGLVTRASYSTSIGRPNIASIIPDTDVNHTTQVVSTNNTAIQPQYGDSFNAGLQYYFEPVGVVSANLFHTRISDFIYNATSTIGSGQNNGFDGEFAGYTLSTRANGGSATIKGIELNYQQQLGFLPGLLRHLSVFANYTFLRTRGSYGGSAAAPTTKLVGFVPESANGGISFSHVGLDVGMKVNYRGERLAAFSANPGAVRYNESRTSVDLNILYKFNQRYSVFFDWMNIFNANDNTDYIYRPIQVGTYIPSGFRMNMGFRVKL
jgi:iron complex outermembrane recepter protein